MEKKGFSAVMLLNLLLLTPSAPPVKVGQGPSTPQLLGRSPGPPSPSKGKDAMCERRGGYVSWVLGEESGQ